LSKKSLFKQWKSRRKSSTREIFAQAVLTGWTTMACSTWPVQAAVIHRVAVLPDKIMNCPVRANEEMNKVTEKLLNENIQKQVKEAFEKQMRQPVQVLFFGKQDDCHYCADTQQLIEEVAALSPQIDLQTHDLEKDAHLASQYQVDKAPGLVILGKDGAQITDYGIRFAGIPSGYEFGTLIQSLVLVSGRDSGLAPKTRQALQQLKEPVNLLVFTTPT
jgi:glutaredoxin